MCNGLEQRVIHLYKNEGESIDDICARLPVNEMQVRTILNKALAVCLDSGVLIRLGVPADVAQQMHKDSHKAYRDAHPPSYKRGKPREELIGKKDKLTDTEVGYILNIKNRGYTPAREERITKETIQQLRTARWSNLLNFIEKSNNVERKAA